MIGAIEQIIRDYFKEVAGGKLEAEQDGWLTDHDSNWGFEPSVLASRIEAAMAVRKNA